MKSDARIRYTRMRIREAFLELLKKKPIAKITVKDVCAKAEINRATFYNHYQDIYDLYEQIQRDEIDKFGAFVKNQAFFSHSIEETICVILESIENDLREHPMWESFKKEEVLLKKLMDYFMEEFEEEICRCYPDYSEEERRIIYKFSAAGTKAAISQWLQDERKVPLKQAAKLIAAKCV